MSKVVDVFKKHQINISHISAGITGVPVHVSEQEQGRYESLELIFQAMLVDDGASHDLRSNILHALWWYQVNPRFFLDISGLEEVKLTLKALKFLNDTMPSSFGGFKFHLIHGGGKWKYGKLEYLECQLIWLENPNETFKDKDIDE